LFVHLRLLLSAIKSDDCIALGFGLVAITLFNLSATAAKKPLETAISIIQSCSQRIATRH
jgi:hypothetical protein